MKESHHENETYISSTGLCAERNSNRLRVPQQKNSQAFSPAELTERAIHRRAVEAVIWGMPAVNYDMMFQAMVRDAKTRPGSNKIVYWSRPFGWKNQTLTPNPDTIYLMPFINTKDVGPVVLEIPPADEGTIVGSVDDCWQAAIEDVGPAGVDKGKGGKYLILPPDYKEKVPDGYIAMPSETYQSYALLRSNVKSKSDADIAAAVAYGKRVKLYPLSQAKNPPATTFVDAIDVVYDANIPYDLRFFESLNRMIQSEPWLRRDMGMIDQLKSIGIEKGKRFNPDAKLQQTLNAGIAEAHAWMDNQYEEFYTTTAEYPDRQWALPASKDLIKATESYFADTNLYPTDSRGVAYSYAFFSPKHLGAGQYYLFAIRDKDGNAFDGANSYRLHILPNVPVRQYWSVTAYDRTSTWAHTRHEVVEPLVADTWPAEKWRWIGRHLLRVSAPRRQGIELGADQREREVRSALPLLWTRKTAVRQDMEATGYRESEVSDM